MKKFEYKEPEFKVVQANTEDIITTSGELPGQLNTASTNWVSAPIMTL